MARLQLFLEKNGNENKTDYVITCQDLHELALHYIQVHVHDIFISRNMLNFQKHLIGAGATEKSDPHRSTTLRSLFSIFYRKSSPFSIEECLLIESKDPPRNYL